MFSALSKQFWLQSAERAVKTFLQTFLGVVATFGVTDSLRGQLVSALLVAAFATAGSLATSMGSERWGDRQSPSVVPSTMAAPKASMTSQKIAACTRKRMTTATRWPRAIWPGLTAVAIGA